MNTKRNVKAIRMVLQHYWGQMRKDWYFNLPGLLLVGIGTTLVAYTPPLVVARILGDFANKSYPTFDSFLPYILVFAGIWALGELLWRIAIHLLIIGESKGSQNLYNRAMDYLLAKDTTFFQDHFAGSLTKKSVAYGRKYVDFMDTITFSVVTSIIPLLFVTFILWRFSPWLVVTLLGIVGLTIALVVPLIRRRLKLVAARETASNVMAGHISDAITNMEAIRSFAREKFETKTHRRHVLDYVTKTKRSWNYENLKIDLVTSPLYVLVNAVGLSVALLLNQNGSISLEAVFVSFSYYVLFTRVMWEFGRIYCNIDAALSEAAQFTELLLAEPKLKDPAEPKAFSAPTGAIEFNNVSFRYYDKVGGHLFKKFNLTITPGEKIALVGRSGGGKTTVTKLLLRFMDVESGEILIDGQNIAHVKQAALRAAIAYVPQDPLMFHRSLSGNIRYGRIGAQDADVRQVAKWAHAAEFIEKLPNGYETLVGERGVKLSGGQRQRIAIARAMIKNAPILVLDEATSSLDSESEKYIQDALWKLMEGRTAIVIAHRLSTIQRMDRIIVLEEGKIVEEGMHKQLLKNKGIYATLWAHQSGGFLED